MDGWIEKKGKVDEGKGEKRKTDRSVKKKKLQREPRNGEKRKEKYKHSLLIWESATPRMAAEVMKLPRNTEPIRYSTFLSKL